MHTGLTGTVLIEVEKFLKKNQEFLLLLFCFVILVVLFQVYEKCFHETSRKMTGAQQLTKASS